MKIDNEEDFRKIPRLRLRFFEDDQSWRGVSIVKTYRKDHLYFHGKGTLAIYLQRPTSLSFTHAVKKYLWWTRKSNPTTFLGYFDGIIHFHPKRLEDVPEIFLKSACRGASGRWNRRSSLASTVGTSGMK